MVERATSTGSTFLVGGIADPALPRTTYFNKTNNSSSHRREPRSDNSTFPTFPTFSDVSCTMGRYCFCGHESFLCKAQWLKKGYDFASTGHGFNQPDAVVRLGVGKNMVASIRFWLRAFGLIDATGVRGIASYLFDDATGRDPYCEDVNTLWVLHYRLVTAGVASLYGLVFLEFQRQSREFDREQLLAFVRRKCDSPEQRTAFNENTVRKDISVLLRSYSPPAALKSIEDFGALLLPLGLLRRRGSAREVYGFAETSAGAIDPLVVLYALADCSGGDLTVSADRLQELALAFCMPFGDFLGIVRRLAARFPDILSYTDDSGIRNAQFLRIVDPAQFLDRYYNHPGMDHEKPLAT